MAGALARVVHEMDVNLAPTEVITMREQVNRYSLRSQQIAVTLLGIFGGLAVLLAAIGLYGVMSHTVNQSTRELGLRIALGASAKDLSRLVFTQGFFLTTAGVVIGSATALFLTRLIGSLLYQVNPRDPAAFASALAVLIIISIAAVLLPAIRATKTDPARVLRE
jgi:putative ABC transport system permease protein